MTSIRSRVEQDLAAMRPFLAIDGGNVRIARLSRLRVLYLKWEGACRHCPVRPMTQASLEEAVRQAAPELTGIEVW